MWSSPSLPQHPRDVVGGSSLGAGVQWAVTIAGQLVPGLALDPTRWVAGRCRCGMSGAADVGPFPEDPPQPSTCRPQTLGPQLLTDS